MAKKMWFIVGNGAWLLCLPLLASPIDEAWRFTRADYGALKASGGSFHLAPDSLWLDEKFGRALLATLPFALKGDPNGAVCEELSFRDFFHGHIVCEKPTPERLQGLIREFHDKSGNLESEAMGEEVYEVRPETLERYGEAVEKIKVLAHELVAAVRKERLCERPAMVFHTVENTKPDAMDYGDPRRNLRTCLNTMVPACFEPSSRGSASSFHTDYDELFQVVFIVDKSGAVHAAPGTERTLSPVLGRPYAQGDWK